MSNLITVIVILLIPLLLAFIVRGCLDASESSLKIGTFELKGFAFEYFVGFTLNAIIYCSYQAVAATIFTLITFFGRFV